MAKIIPKSFNVMTSTTCPVCKALPKHSCKDGRGDLQFSMHEARLVEHNDAAFKAFKKEVHKEYLVVSDKNSKVLLSSENLGACRKLLGKIREAGGSATLFKALKF